MSYAQSCQSNEASQIKIVYLISLAKGLDIAFSEPLRLGQMLNKKSERSRSTVGMLSSDRQETLINHISSHSVRQLHVHISATLIPYRSTVHTQGK